MRKRYSIYTNSLVLEQEQLANICLTTFLVQYSKSRHQLHLPSWEVRIHIAVQDINHCKCVICLQYSHSPSPTLLVETGCFIKTILFRHPTWYKLINSLHAE